jgi:hypothetical protein
LQHAVVWFALSLLVVSSMSPVAASADEDSNEQDSSSLAIAVANSVAQSPNPTSHTPGGEQPGGGALPGVGTLTGTVVDSSGAPLVDCFIVPKPLTAGLVVQEIAIYSDGAGAFSLSLMPGEWIVQAVCPGGITGTTQAVSLPNQGTAHVKIVADAVAGSTSKANPAGAVATVKASLKGRTLVVVVKATGGKKPSGKKLVTVIVGKKTIKANLNSQGKASVKIPKVKRGTKIKVKFLGTSSTKPARTVVTVKR